ncbi:MATE family efflux transporter [uncultured Bacteroides sp.]|uniref:MATE family efflux transporter n=1 Tax=uncultured Bacteroides sp. TaxID=162156 RepID=UPI0025DF0E8C|nr:MATE family efflux transporter [uncultured Bacteroides sp.]
MKTKYTYKQIWLIAYPILISLLMEQMIGMTDTAFLGRVGEVELGASAIAGIFYMVIFMVAFGFSIGTQILIARRNGEKEYKEIGELFYQGIYFQIGMATVMFLLSYCLSPLILKRIVSSEHIYEAATSYLHWRVFGAFFSFSAVIFRAFFLGTTLTKTLTLNSIVMVLSNIVFNYILIFGKFGFPELGIAGAAIGSSLAELVSLIFFILYTRSRIDCRKYGLDRIPKINFGVLKRMLNVSLWTMIQNSVSLSTWFLFFLYVEHMGERSLAITNIVRSVSGILFMVMMAFASTCGSLVSNLIGSGNTDCVPGTIRQHVRIAYLFVLPLALLFALFPNQILGIYTDMTDLQQASVHSLWVMCAAYLFLVPANVYFQSVSGTGNTRTALGLEMGTLVIYVAYITYIILYLQLDVAICWTSEMVYSIFILLFSWMYIKRGNWQGRKI